MRKNEGNVARACDPSTVEGAEAPSESALRQAALRHLARYAATEARLLAVLNRRVKRWARAAKEGAPEDEDVGVRAAGALAAARRVVAVLVAQGAVNDAAYAQSRVRTLRRAGRSGAAIARHLAERGIGFEAARAVVGDDGDAELGAALLLAKKRRLGAFGSGAEEDAAGRRRVLGAFARAGFSREVAGRALATPLAEAEALILAMRMG